MVGGCIPAVGCPFRGISGSMLYAIELIARGMNIMRNMKGWSAMLPLLPLLTSHSGG